MVWFVCPLQDVFPLACAEGAEESNYWSWRAIAIEFCSVGCPREIIRGGVMHETVEFDVHVVCLCYHW
jgi:hypothetical protein